MQNKRYAFSQYKVNRPQNTHNEYVCSVEKLLKLQKITLLSLFIRLCSVEIQLKSENCVGKLFEKRKKKTIKEEDSRSFGCSEAERTQRSFQNENSSQTHKLLIYRISCERSNVENLIEIIRIWKQNKKKETHQIQNIHFKVLKSSNPSEHSDKTAREEFT